MGETSDDIANTNTTVSHGYFEISGRMLGGVLTIWKDNPTAGQGDNCAHSGKEAQCHARGGNLIGALEPVTFSRGTVGPPLAARILPHQPKDNRHCWYRPRHGWALLE